MEMTEHAGDYYSPRSPRSPRDEHRDYNYDDHHSDQHVEPLDVQEDHHLKE